MILYISLCTSSLPQLGIDLELVALSIIEALETCQFHKKVQSAPCYQKHGRETVTWDKGGDRQGGRTRGDCALSCWLRTCQ
jgi:hypothetical protein